MQFCTYSNDAAENTDLVRVLRKCLPMDYKVLVDPSSLVIYVSDRNLKSRLIQDAIDVAQLLSDVLLIKDGPLPFFP
jgi:hypothetical protein